MDSWRKTDRQMVQQLNEACYPHSLLGLERHKEVAVLERAVVSNMTSSPSYMPRGYSKPSVDHRKACILTLTSKTRSCQTLY